jgi:hypothetical protein
MALSIVIVTGLCREAFQFITIPTKLLVTPWSSVFPEKLLGAQLILKSPRILWKRGSLPHSQEPANSS